MAYILSLMAVLGVFLWATPAHKHVVDAARAGAGIVADIASPGTGRLRTEANQIIAAVRVNALELLREQIHKTVDVLVH